MAFYSQGKTPFLVKRNGKKEKISFAAYRDEDHQIGCCHRNLLSGVISSRKQRHCFLFAAGSTLVSVMIVIVLYTTVLIKKKQASYFSCVVFLSIVVNHVGDSNPFLFVWNRFLDTVIGIMIGIGVNSFSLPKEKKKDILFISGLDDTLLYEDDNLSDYSRIELNRMLDEGANFTISTMRTPASLMKPMRDIHLKLPVIAMDGAVLYDINENAYLKVYVISNVMSLKVFSLIEEQGLSCFANVIIDDMLVIYYKETEDDVHRRLIKEMRISEKYDEFEKNSDLWKYSGTV